MPESLKTLHDVPVHAPLSCFTHMLLVSILFPHLVSLALPRPLLFIYFFNIHFAMTNYPSFPRNYGRCDSTSISPISSTANQELNP